MLHYAVRAKLLDENPASAVPNPEPKRTEVATFTLDELDLLADELSPTFGPIPTFAALTGLRRANGQRLSGATSTRPPASSQSAAPS